MVEQTAAAVTLDDIMNMGDRWFEVVDGAIVYLWGEDGRMSPGFLHNQIAGNIYALLRQHVRGRDLGYVCTDGLEYVLDIVAGEVKRSRLPDASFIRLENLPDDFDVTRPFVGAPDLAVEVVSPSNSATEILERVADFLNAGTDEVWVVYPVRREVYHHRRSTPDVVRVFREDDTLQTAVLPDLRLKVAQLFEI